MIIDKEYPATHSMSTAWYCVDEDGIVGVFDIDDNGPVPTDFVNTDTSVDEVFWETFSTDDGNKFRSLNLSPEQIEPLLKPLDREDVWEKSDRDWLNASWMEVIIKVDMSKLDILAKALKMDRPDWCNTICLSKESGLFYTDFFFNKKGVELLEKNNVVLARYKAPSYDAPWDEEFKDAIIEENRRFPFYIYWQDYWPDDKAAVLINKPAHPLKYDQLPPNIKEKIFHIPVRFDENEKIQMARYVPVEVTSVVDSVYYDEKVWSVLKLEDGTNGYYNQETNKLMFENEMKPLLDSGKAEDYDAYMERQRKEIEEQYGDY